MLTINKAMRIGPAVIVRLYQRLRAESMNAQTFSMTDTPRLRLYDTLAREKRPFKPIDPANVRMYACGPTVYDFAHIGNARPVIVFDVLFRLLRHLYGETHVTYVRNITDVDDRINARATRDFPGLPLNAAIRRVTELTEKQFHDDVDALGCLRPSVEPRATNFVVPRADLKADMVTLIKQLIARGHAYEAGGEVLFDTQSMPDYGALSGRKLDEQQAGVRVAVDAHKKHANDFVLWKQSSAEEPGWDSPWGTGRPGWHIECSAMSAAYLGETFDIHGGGLDLIFPHHENEIAQSRCAHGTSVMANYWMHNGFLQVEGEKMSKSVGNFITIREVLKDWPGEVVRLNMLKTHYRQPIDWTVKGLEENRKILAVWRSAIQPHYLSNEPLDPAADVVDALSDDLNLPATLAVFHGLAREARAGNALAAKKLVGSADLIGVKRSAWEEKADEFFTPSAPDGEFSGRVADLLEKRKAARAAKNFNESDRIRDELLAMGVVLKDSKDGTTWEFAR
jgi:cysteinyl-tRNA synthetase